MSKCVFCTYATEADAPLARSVAEAMELFNAARVASGEPVLSASEMATSLTVVVGYLMGMWMERIRQRALRAGVPASVFDDAFLATFCAVHRHAVEHLTANMPHVFGEGVHD